MSDDLGKLIGHAQWSGPVYQTFRRLQLDAATAPETTNDTADAGITPASRLSLLTYREQRVETGGGPRFGALRSLLLGDTPAAQRQAPVRVPVVRLVGGSGGCGVTTIVAAMARALAGSGDSTVVIDADPDSPLPCHLGIRDRQEGPGLHTAILPSAHPIFLLKRYDAPGADQPDEWLQQGLASLRHGLDRILVDGTPRFWTGNATEFENALSIVVLTPDFTSLYRLDALLERYANQPVLFLLNKFDASVSLHEQVRVWLGRKLGNRLLNLTLRRTDEIAEALADGVTVLDYAPDSAISDDLRCLRDIVREWNGVDLPIQTTGLVERSA
ncbi:MAG: hypothetical protein JNK87_16935 [Bryobacterales bacterium]|nr:hypothetical protein [Bryobacterales bacterium]